MKVKLLPLALMALASLLGISANAQCAVSSKVASGTFDIVPSDSKDNINVMITPSRKDDVVVQIKFPKLLSEVKNRPDIIDCPAASVLPGGSKVTYIKILSVSGLPSTVTWTTSKASYVGNDTGCLFFKHSLDQSKTHAKGTYPVKVTIEAKGVYAYIPATVKCYLNNYKLIVQ